MNVLDAPPSAPPAMPPPAPVVTIGMPVFNGERYLAQAIDSLLAQTFTDFELVISDNASTDGTSIICSRYALTDSRIRYIRQDTNLGPIPNFVFLLAHARGRFFMWAAADDSWADNWLHDLIAAIRPTDIVVRGTPVVVDEDGRFIEHFDLRSHRRNGHLRMFLENESRSRAYYFYGLYETEKLRAVDNEPLRNAPYGKDLLYLANMISAGDVRHIASTEQYCRRHAASAGSAEFARTGWRRIVYRVQPFSYYYRYFSQSPLGKKPLLLVMIPFKHAYLQAALWRRAFFKVLRILRSATARLLAKSATP